MPKLSLDEKQLRDEMFHEQGMIWCADCRQFKPAEYFYKSSFVRSNYGHKSYCKDCAVNVRNARYNQGARNKQRHRDKKWKMLQLVGGKCCRCGYNEFEAGLDFHHVDPTEKDITKFSNIGLEKAMAEVDKCVVLCRNCHTTLHAGEWSTTFIKRDGIGWTIAADPGTTRIYADTSDDQRRAEHSRIFNGD